MLVPLGRSINSKLVVVSILILILSSEAIARMPQRVKPKTSSKYRKIFTIAGGGGGFALFADPSPAYARRASTGTSLPTMINVKLESDVKFGGRPANSNVPGVD